MKWKFLLVFLLLFALAPHAQAWEWVTHRRVAQYAFDALPENIKRNLIWLEIYNGSTLPDTDRTKYPGHTQPAARYQAAYWLGIAKTHYLENNFPYASLALGIACHYIADAVTLPHNVLPFEQYWHNEFELDGIALYPATPAGIPNFNLEELLTKYHNEAPTKWSLWKQTRDMAIVQEGVDLAASYTYNAWYEALVGEIPSQESQPSSLPVVAAGVALAALAGAIAIGMKRYYRM